MAGHVRPRPGRAWCFTLAVSVLLRARMTKLIRKAIAVLLKLPEERQEIAVRDSASNNDEDGER